MTQTQNDTMRKSERENPEQLDATPKREMLTFEQLIKSAPPPKEMWKKVMRKAEELSEKMQMCSAQYIEQKDQHMRDSEAAELFSTAALVVSQELYAIFALARFFFEYAEAASTAAEIRGMFGGICLGKGTRAFDAMTADIFGVSAAAD